MKFTDEEGKVWEGVSTEALHGQRWVLIQSIPIYEFGGVRFEETGEVRYAEQGEWYLINGIPAYTPTDRDCLARPILRPLQGE